MIPQFMYALLGNGSISPSAFALWATIRLFARDQVRSTFSPGPVALTTTQLAQLMGLSETHIKNLVGELESAGTLGRQLGGNSRQLQLCAPEGITRHSIYPSLYLPVNAQEEELIASENDLEAPPPEALSGEGGVGGTIHPSPYLPVNDLPGSTVPPKSAIAELLRERGAFPRVADDIAAVLIAAGITDLDEVRDLVNAVIRQVVAEGAKETQVIGRAMSRLRNGDWDMEAVRAQAVAEAQTAAYARYTTQVPPAPATEDAGNNGAGVPAAAPATAQTAGELPRADEAAQLWQQTLEVLRLGTTNGIFNQWFLRSRAIGYNGNGDTLVVSVHNAAAVQVLSGERMMPLIQRSLRDVAGADVPVRFVEVTK
jgi:hypothetical protein